MGVFQNIDIVIDIVVCMTVTCKPKYPVTGNFLPGNALHSCLSLIWWESPVNWEIQKTNNPNTEQCHCGGNLLYQDNIAAKTGIFGKHLWQILAVLNKSGVYHQLWVAEESSGGVLLNTIFSKVGPKCWGKKGITSGRRMEPIADYRSLKRLRDVAAFTSLQLLSRRKQWPPSRLTRPSTTRVRECVLGDAAEVDQWCGGDGLCAAENHNRHSCH